MLPRLPQIHLNEVSRGEAVECSALPDFLAGVGRPGVGPHGRLTPFSPFAAETAAKTLGNHPQREIPELPPSC